MAIYANKPALSDPFTSEPFVDKGRSGPGRYWILVAAARSARCVDLAACCRYSTP
jgi:hypothetical protein